MSVFGCFSSSVFFAAFSAANLIESVILKYLSCITMITGMKSKQMFQTFPKITKLRAKNSIVHESHEND